MFVSNKNGMRKFGICVKENNPFEVVGLDEFKTALMEMDAELTRSVEAEDFDICLYSKKYDVVMAMVNKIIEAKGTSMACYTEHMEKGLSRLANNMAFQSKYFV